MLQLTFPNRVLALSPILGLVMDLEAPETVKADEVFSYKATVRLLFLSIPATVKYLGTPTTLKDEGKIAFVRADLTQWGYKAASGAEQSLSGPIGLLNLEAVDTRGLVSAIKKILALSPIAFYFEYINYPEGYSAWITINVGDAGMTLLEGIGPGGVAKMAVFPLTEPTWFNGNFPMSDEKGYATTLFGFAARATSINFLLSKDPSKGSVEKAVLIKLDHPGIFPMVRYEVDISAGTMKVKADLR